MQDSSEHRVGLIKDFEDGARLDGEMRALMSTPWRALGRTRPAMESRRSAGIAFAGDDPDGKVQQFRFPSGYRIMRRSKTELMLVGKDGDGSAVRLIITFSGDQFCLTGAKRVTTSAAPGSPKARGYGETGIVLRKPMTGHL